MEFRTQFLLFLLLKVSLTISKTIRESISELAVVLSSRLGWHLAGSQRCHALSQVLLQHYRAGFKTANGKKRNPSFSTTEGECCTAL